MQITMKQLVSVANQITPQQQVNFLKPFLERPAKGQALSYAKHLTKGLNEDELYELLTFLQEQYNDKDGWEFFCKWRRKEGKVKKKKRLSSRK